jgi:hypothetical protein
MIYDMRCNASVQAGKVFPHGSGPAVRRGARRFLRCILPAGREAFMAKNELYIERREQGDYAVRRPGSERASAILPTQARAIERAREINPDAAVHVERVRDTNVGVRDKWRKA